MTASLGTHTFVDLIYLSVDSLSDDLRPINSQIHGNPEICYEEFVAHETLVSFLKTRPGWKVHPSAYDIPTAFIAEFDGGKDGPVVSFHAEYDALPGIGHACGHNLIAIASLSAALAVGAVIEKHALPGKVILFGTPAEEGGGGKIKLLHAGAYRDHKIDVSLMAHPGGIGDKAFVSTSAYTRFKAEYFGKAAHAASNPWQGINALDALVMAYNGLSILRQQTMPGDIISAQITNGGQAPNIIHEYASGVFVVRANTRARREVLAQRAYSCFNGSAQATGAMVKITHESSYDDHTPNHALALCYRQQFNALGGNIPTPEIDLWNGRTAASTDQGNISYAYPSLHSTFKIESEAGPHNPGFAKCAGTEDSYLKALRCGKALAATAVEVLTRPGLLEKIKGEFERLVK